MDPGSGTLNFGYTKGRTNCWRGQIESNLNLYDGFRSIMPDSARSLPARAISFQDFALGRFFLKGIERNAPRPFRDEDYASVTFPGTGVRCGGITAACR